MTSGRPFLGALNLALCKLYCNQVNGEDSAEYEVNRRNQVEAIYHNRRNMMNEIYGQAKGEVAEELGIVDLKALEDRETNFFVHYNWLHFLVQIVLLL